MADKKKIDNHPSAGNPDPKTVSNATRVNEPYPENVDPNHPSSGTGPSNPDPKTVSNATRVNEEVAPHPENVNNNSHDNPLSKKDNELPPSSDQPDEIERKTQEQLQYEEKGRKKLVVEGGENDTSHATIGKGEEKEAREQNKDFHNKKSSHKKSSSSKDDDDEEEVKKTVFKKEEETKKKF